MNNKVSEMITALEKSVNSIPQINEPEGMFHRKVVIQSGNITINSDELDVEFDIPFSDSIESDEAEIAIYNLTENSIEQLKYNQEISITAGYGNDLGLIFLGRIISITTKFDKNDKKTTIQALDSQSLKDRVIESIAYQKNASASYILKDLVGRTKIPVAVFKTLRDYTYKDGTTIDGNLNEKINNFAKVCGVSAFIHKGKWHIRNIKDGDNISFTVNQDTGLLGSPEEFEEEITAEEFSDTIKGCKVKMLLQHRIGVASIINLSSREVKGTFRVRNGNHKFSGNDFITEFNCI